MSPLSLTIYLTICLAIYLAIMCALYLVSLLIKEVAPQYKRQQLWSEIDANERRAERND